MSSICQITNNPRGLSCNQLCPLYGATCRKSSFPPTTSSVSEVEAIVESAYNLQDCEGTPTSLAGVRSSCQLASPCSHLYDDDLGMLLQIFGPYLGTTGTWVCYNDFQNGDFCFSSYSPSNVCPCQEVNSFDSAGDVVFWVSMLQTNFTLLVNFTFHFDESPNCAFPFPLNLARFQWAWASPGTHVTKLAATWNPCAPLHY